MSFTSTLEKIVTGSGGFGAALMGSDGIPIDQVSAPGEAGARGDQVAAAGVEFGRLLEEIRKAADAVGGGALAEVAIQLSRSTVLIRAVDDEIFLVLLLPADGNLGKARYLVRRHLLEIREQL